MENPCWPPTYVATVAYGKEEFAELEIGDALYSLDPEIKVCRTPYGGLLLLKTSVTEEVATKTLLATPPSTLRRFMKVLFCCEIPELFECLKRNVTILLGFSYLRVSERSGVSYGRVAELLNSVGYRPSPGGGYTLSVEPLEGVVCFTKQLLTFKNIS